MRRAIPLAVAVVLIALGCDLGVQQRSATRTVVGVAPSQIVAATQSAFVDKGFDLAAVSTSSGAVRTAWNEQPRRQLMYSVVTEQVADEDGNEMRGIWRVVVQGYARDRLVGGWSEEYQTDFQTEEILDAIADRLTDPANPPRLRKTVSKPECKTTADCPSGRHCAAQKCVAECEGDEGCADGETCDDRGRCVAAAPAPKSATKPAPKPAPSPAAPAEDEAEEDEDETEEDEDETEEDEGEEVAP